MNLLRSSGREFFLDEIYNYLFTNFRHQYENVRIVLPNGFLCSALQHKFLSTKKALILPNIITLDEIIAEGYEILKMPCSAIETFSPLEEKITLGEIIASYPKFSFSLAASIKFAPELARLFHEIELNEIDIEKLKSISGDEEAKHWQDIYQFIQYAYDSWQQQISDRSKVSRASFQKQMFDAEISRLQTSPTSHLIIAGIVPVSHMEREFFNNILQLKTGHVIVPHFPAAMLEKACDIGSDKIKPEHPLFGLVKFYEHISINNHAPSIASINTVSDNIAQHHLQLDYVPDDRFDHLLSTKSDHKLTRKENNDKDSHIKDIDTKQIDYIQFESVHDEAEYIAAKCQAILQSHPDASIAVINPNLACKNIYKRSLIKHVGQGQVRDLIGDNILENNAICLLINWSEFCCNPFDLNRFFKVISNPEIVCKPTILLKKLLLANNRFASNLEEVKSSIDNCNDKAISDEELEIIRSWYDKYANLFSKITGDNFTKILRNIIYNIEKIAPNIWSRHEKFRLADAIREIYQTSWNSKKIKLEDFPELLRSCLEGGRLFTQENICGVVLGRLKDTSLAYFDYSFIVGANEGNIPPALKENPWLNRQARQDLGIYLNSNLYASSIYNFYLNISAGNICISRSSKQLDSKDEIESSLLLQIKLYNNQIKEYRAIAAAPKPLGYLTNSSTAGNEDYVTCSLPYQFPSQISATDIETLIRAPYNFYAKKILKLRAINNLEDYPSFAEFGNFFHAVVEEYTNQYEEIKQKNTGAKLEIFNHIAENILSKTAIPNYSKTSWITKIAAMAPEFIDFEDSRRQSCSKVYTETKGTLDLSIAGKKIKIIAIADRIEINKDGKAIILDYKTGTPPTKSEVLSGQSPQLIIEALIMQNGGFDGQIRDIESVIFVKIASSKPYIRLIEIKLDKNQLAEHMTGLKSLLEHYVTEGKYPIAKCDLKYDDYSHLARR